MVRRPGRQKPAHEESLSKAIRIFQDLDAFNPFSDNLHEGLDDLEYDLTIHHQAENKFDKRHVFWRLGTIIISEITKPQSN